MRRRTLLAVAVALTAAAVPARAMTPVARWVPTGGQQTLVAHGHGAFPDGTGYVFGGAVHGFDTRDTGVPGWETRLMLLRTSDHGRTWVPGVTALPHSANVDVVFTSALDGWASGFGTPALARTTDGGATWDEAAVSLPVTTGEDSGLWQLAASPAGGAVAVAGTVRVAGTDPCAGGSAGRDVVFWTADGGATWGEHRFPDHGSPGSVRVREVRLADADTGILIGYDMECGALGRTLVYVTGDGGASWQLVLEREADETPVQAAAVSADGQHVLLSFGNAMRRSDDGGATFGDPAELRTGTALDSRDTGIHDVALSGGVAYATQRNGAVHRSTDGTAWTFDGVTAGLGARLALFDADRAFAVAEAAGPVSTRLVP